MREVKNKFINFLLIGLVLGGCIGGWLWISIQNYGLHAEISRADYFVFVSDPQLFFPTFFLMPVFLISLSQMLQNTGRIQVIIRERNRGQVWRRCVRKVIDLAAGLTIYLSVFVGVLSLISGTVSFNWREKHSVYWAWCGRQVLKTKSIHLANVAAAFVINEIVLLCTVGILFTFIYFLTSNLWAGWLCCEGLMLYRWSTLRSGSRTGVIQKLTIDWGIWDDIRKWLIGIIMGISVFFFIYGIGYICAKKKGFFK